jgi:hypothetical protein
VLNVGGTLFETSRATLVNSPHDSETFFDKLLVCRLELPRDSTGAIFLGTFSYNIDSVAWSMTFKSIVTVQVKN